MSNRENDAHPQGGSLTDMAVEGTSVPSDAAEPRYIPSKPRPDQTTEEGLGSSNLAQAADNAGDIARNPSDQAPNEVITGTGDGLPAEVGQKNLHNVAQGELSKGHPRYDKHVRQQGSELNEDTRGEKGEEPV